MADIEFEKFKPQTKKWKFTIANTNTEIKIVSTYVGRKNKIGKQT